MHIRRRLLGPFLAMGLVVGAAAAPCAWACSCIEPLPLAESIQAQTAVVVGRVGVPVGGRYPFSVERWFTGPAPAAVLTLSSGEERMDDGSVVINTCGRTFEPGQRLVLVGEQDGNHLATSACSLGAGAESAEGMKLIAEAERLFGAGIRPTAADDSEGRPSGDGSTGLLPVVLIGAAALGLGGLTLAGVILLARRREG